VNSLSLLMHRLRPRATRATLRSWRKRKTRTSIVPAATPRPPARRLCSAKPRWK
jgi:hypothetical protein